MYIYIFIYIYIYLTPPNIAIILRSESVFFSQLQNHQKLSINTTNIILVTDKPYTYTA